jgi:LPPG:FO 2-phospho-L-lactate transferase
MPRILAITGGVGGAKLALGLSKVLGPEEVLFAVNTGDDFEHLGLTICPDIDSLTYALAEENNTQTGWGRQGETWHFMDALTSFGGETWFRLGDKDLALHTVRTQLLKGGATLTDATAHIASSLEIEHSIAPMSDDPVRTIVHTANGSLPFQHYFVREKCNPAVTGFEFAGIEKARLNPRIERWLDDCAGIIICPSNPYVSVDPLLRLDGFADRLNALPVVAVSPIVGGIAIKGPAAKMMKELDVPATASAVARHYGELLDGFVLDETDATEAAEVEVATLVTKTIMQTLEDRVDLASATLAFLNALR